MNSSPLLIFLLFYTTNCFSQKPLIDSSTFGKWPKIGITQISNDGNYVLYTIINYPKKSQTLVIQSTNNFWKMKIPGARNSVITRDSRMAIFMAPDDSLAIVDFETHNIDFLGNVDSYTVPKGNNTEWLIYHLNGPRKEFVLKNLITGEVQQLEGVVDFQFSDDGEEILLKTPVTGDNLNSCSIKLLSLANKQIKTIWQGNNPNHFAFDDEGKQIVFFSEEGKDKPVAPILWYYNTSMAKAMVLVNDQTSGVDGRWLLNDAMPEFNKKGDRIFLRVKEVSENINNLKYNLNRKSVDIWSYKDSILQSYQLEHILDADRFNDHGAVVNIKEKTITVLDRQQEGDVDFTFLRRGDHVLVGSKTEGVDDFLLPYPSFTLVDTKDGIRKMVKAHFKWGTNSSLRLSPSEKFVIYYDGSKDCFFSYNTSTGVTKNISKNIGVPLFDDEYDQPDKHTHCFGIGGWFPNDSSVLLYDKYDIWKVDPNGIRYPIDITRGYGRKFNIIFRLPLVNLNSNICEIQVNGSIVLSAFSPLTKLSGFYSLCLERNTDPKLLTMGPYLYDLVDLNNLYLAKTKGENVFVVERMNAMEAPNLFVTKDFKSYNQLSDIQPQKKYNWIRSQLITWKMSDGKASQGILYRPENFNPHKKYPVIVHLYERLSDNLNEFLFPEVTTARINIPYFVSNGYIVFEPDIHYKVGRVTESVENSVVSALKYLSCKSFVNAKRIGVQGHSFGGYEVNCLITHTHLFAAAAEASGVSDLISDYGAIAFRGISLQGLNENGQNRIGATLWQKPDLYIRNSPIFFANNVNTPLLMMNNNNDYAVPFSQGVEFFTALRRLQKKVWMLQYDRGDHVLGGESGEDYTIRLKQFFDHYLKDAPAPLWMIKGIPAILKGYYSGLESDNN